MASFFSFFSRKPLQPTETQSPIRLDKESILSSIDESREISDAVKKNINNRIAARLTATTAFAGKAKKAFVNFSASRRSPEIRQSTLNYINKSDDFEIVQQTLIKQAVDNANKFKEKLGIKFSITKEQAKELGLDIEANPTAGQIATTSILDFIEGGLQGIDIVSPLSAFERCRLEAEIDKTLSGELTSVSTNDNIEETNESIETAPSNELAIGIEHLINDNISKQMEHAASPETVLRYGPSERANQTKIDETIEGFQLHSGPADVIAQHDFFDLQIAFPHIWTELFDEELPLLGMMLEKILVGWETELGVAPDLKTINNTEELHQVINDIREASAAIAQNDPRLKEVKRLVPEATNEIWMNLEEEEKESLYDLAILVQHPEQYSKPIFEVLVPYWKATAQVIVNNGKLELQAKAKNKKQTRLMNMLEDLEQRLAEKYTFDVFYADPKRNKYSVNFGVLINYRQMWNPLTYQVGELVSTIPLAPKEARRYSTKHVVKKTRAIKEVENALNIKKDESSSTARDHTEIVRRAKNNSNFKTTAEGGVNFAVWNAKGSHSLEINAAKQSADTKKAFREAVVKAAEEHKNENRLELSTTASEEVEQSTSGEISNPNDELPVTYLFYELQRRYEISERLHKLSPVVLIANEVPRPDQIDEEWLTAHAWILQRVILDDSYLRALGYLSEGFAGDELATEVLRVHFRTQIEIVDRITNQIKLGAGALEKSRSEMEWAIKRYSSTQAEGSGGLLGGIGSFLFGGGTDFSETYRIQMEAAKEAFERLEREQSELRARLEQDVTALQAASDGYAEALRNQFNRRTEILRLRAHVKDNILYYMQAIWDQEPPDQRFFRLYDVDVFDITGQFEHDTTLMVSTANLFPWLGAQQITQPNKISIYGTATLPTKIEVKKKKLVEIADLDAPLGYKGNYTIYPLKKNNAITLYMMQDYLKVDDIVGAHDPDELGNYTSDEVIDFAKCLYKKSPKEYRDARPWIRDLLVKRLSNPYREKDTIVVPTISLFIEALPGAHPILEDFKLIHRAVDVKKAQASVRHDELENIRLAGRALGGEYDDPEIEKNIVIKTDTKNVTVSTDTE